MLKKAAFLVVETRPRAVPRDFDVNLARGEQQSEQFRLVLRLCFALRLSKWIHLRRSFDTFFAA